MRTFLISLCIGSAVGTSNINKVIELLTSLKNKVGAEGEVEQEQYATYSQWARDEIINAKNSVDTDKSKIEDLQAIIEETTGTIQTASSKVTELGAGISANEKSLEEATAERKQKREDFLKAEAELTDAIDELVRANSVLKRAGLGGSAGTQAVMKSMLAQISGGLTAVMNAAEINSADKRKLQSMLQSKTEEDDDDLDFPQAKTEAYTSHAGSIIDTIAELKVKAESERNKLRNEETADQHKYDLLRQSLQDEMKVQNRDLGDNQKLAATANEEKSKAEGDLTETQDSLKDMEEYLSTLEQQREAKSEAWMQRQKARAQELDAITVAIESLSQQSVTSASKRMDKKSLMQMRDVNHHGVRDEVAAVLQEAAERLHSVGLAQLAVRTKGGDDAFGKVKELIREMIMRLQKNAAAEADEKAFCDKETSDTDGKKQKLGDRVDELSTRIDKSKAAEATLKEEIADGTTEIAELDAALAAATKQRQKESQEFLQVDADTNEMIQALTGAIETLRNYYSGGGGSSLVQQNKVADYKGPIFDNKGYKSAITAAGGIVAMLETILEDTERTRVEAQADEKQAADQYSKYKQTSEINRAKLDQEVKGKTAEVAMVQVALKDNGKDMTDTNTELSAVLEYSAKLRERCTHKPMSFEERAARREQEIESLQQALEILENETAGGEPQGFLQRM